MKDTKLSELRSEIEKIDDDIINSLSRRINIAKEIGKVKKEVSNSENPNIIFPKREFEVIGRVLEKRDALLPASTVISIWRQIISSAISMQVDLKIGIHNPKNKGNYKPIIEKHYGDLFSIEEHESVMSIFHAIENNKTYIGVFELPEGNNSDSSLSSWWVNLINNKSDIEVFGVIPSFYKEQDSEAPKLVTVGKIQSEPTGIADSTLVCLEVPRELSNCEVVTLLDNLKREYRILQRTELKAIPDCVFYLLSLNGFIEKNDDFLMTIKHEKYKIHVKVIGHYIKAMKI